MCSIRSFSARGSERALKNATGRRFIVAPPALKKNRISRPKGRPEEEEEEGAGTY